MITAQFYRNMSSTDAAYAVLYHAANTAVAGDGFWNVLSDSHHRFTVKTYPPNIKQCEIWYLPRLRPDFWDEIFKVLSKELGYKSCPYKVEQSFIDHFKSSNVTKGVLSHPVSIFE
jgi:hypothetical protein